MLTNEEDYCTVNGAYASVRSNGYEYSKAAAQAIQETLNSNNYPRAVLITKKNSLQSLNPMHLNDNMKGPAAAIQGAPGALMNNYHSHGSVATNAPNGM